jgi:hypothetical protein
MVGNVQLDWTRVILFVYFWRICECTLNNIELSGTAAKQIITTQLLKFLIMRILIRTSKDFYPRKQGCSSTPS